MSILVKLAKQVLEQKKIQEEESKYDQTKVILTNIGPYCRKCWSSYGKALTMDCCICNGGVVFEERPFVETPIHYLIPKKQPAKKKKK